MGCFFSLQVQHRTEYSTYSLSRALQQSNIISHGLYLIPLFTYHGTLLALSPATHGVFIFKVSICCYICSAQLHKYISCLQNTTFDLASNTGFFINPFSPVPITLYTAYPASCFPSPTYSGITDPGPDAVCDLKRIPLLTFHESLFLFVVTPHILPVYQLSIKITQAVMLSEIVLPKTV